MNEFFCCKKDSQFKRVKNGYQCIHCGKIYPDKEICYLETNYTFKKIKYDRKLRGRKVDYIETQDYKIIATLRTGIIHIDILKEGFKVINKKEFSIKKNVLAHKLNVNNTFLTISEKGVINLYNMKTGEMFSEIKLGVEYNGNELKIFPFGKDGAWLFIDTDKISIFSNDFKIESLVFLFKDKLNCNSIMWISNVDYNSDYDCFAIHINYRLANDEDTRVKRASFILKKNGNEVDVEQYEYNVNFNLTYDFKNEGFYGIQKDIVIKMDKECYVTELGKVPFIKSHSDGGGILWLEEFINYPEKIYFLSSNIIILLYLSEIIIVNIDRNTIEYSFDLNGGLIQSFIFLDFDTICFSAGLNTYIVQLDLN